MARARAMMRAAVVLSAAASLLALAAAEGVQETIGRPDLSTKLLHVPRKTLMGPGPSNASPRVLEAARKPLLGHLHPEFVTIMDEVSAWLKYSFQTRSDHTLAISGTGHAAMEAAVANFVEAGDVVLVGVNGIWGERMVDLVERYGGVVVQMTKPAGQVFYLEEIEAELGKRDDFKLLFLTHGESSTGTMQPLAGVGEACHRHGALLFLDTVCTLGCVPLNVEEQGVDITYSGSQKCLGAPPGASPMTVSDRAVAKLQARSSPPSTYYLDLTLLGKYWGFGEGKGAPRWYHHTGMVTNVYALREALATLADEGLEAAWQRHTSLAAKLWEGLEGLGLELFVEDPAARLPTVTTVKVPAGVDWKQVTSYLMSKHKLEIAGGLGPTAGKVWRIGLMGYNARQENVDFVVESLKEALAAAREGKEEL